MEIPARCFTCEYGQKQKAYDFNAPNDLLFGDSRCNDLSNYSPYNSMRSLSTNCPLDEQYCVTEVVENETLNSVKRYCSNEDQKDMHERTNFGRDH